MLIYTVAGSWECSTVARMSDDIKQHLALLVDLVQQVRDTQTRSEKDLELFKAETESQLARLVAAISSSPSSFPVPSYACCIDRAVSHSPSPALLGSSPSQPVPVQKSRVVHAEGESRVEQLYPDRVVLTSISILSSLVLFLHVMFSIPWSSGSKTCAFGMGCSNGKGTRPRRGFTASRFSQKTVLYSLSLFCVFHEYLVMLLGRMVVPIAFIVLCLWLLGHYPRRIVQILHSLHLPFIFHLNLLGSIPTISSPWILGGMSSQTRLLKIYNQV